MEIDPCSHLLAYGYYTGYLKILSEELSDKDIQKFRKDHEIGENEIFYQKPLVVVPDLVFAGPLANIDSPHIEHVGKLRVYKDRSGVVSRPYDIDVFHVKQLHRSGYCMMTIPASLTMFEELEKDNNVSWSPENSTFSKLQFIKCLKSITRDRADIIALDSKLPAGGQILDIILPVF